MAAHVFDPEVAAKVGLNAAVIHQNIAFWCEKNAANDRHVHDGHAWTYNSVKAFCLMFPYLTEKQIRGALEKLEETGLIVSGNFNTSAYDRTKWYRLGGQAHLPSGSNGNVPEGEPIPDNKPDGKPDGKNVREEEGDLLSIVEAPKASKNDEAFDRFWAVYPKKAGKPSARKAWDKAVKEDDPEAIIAAARRYAASENVSRGYAKHPQGWLNDQRWRDADLHPPPQQPSLGDWREVLR